MQVPGKSKPRRDSYPARLLRALYSAIVPGVGQLAAGVRGRGLVMLGIFLALTVAGIIIFLQGTDAVLSYLVRPSVLLAIFVLDIVVLLVRVAAVWDAWRTPKLGAPDPVRPSRTGMAILIAGLVLVFAFTVAPHVAAGYYTLVSRDLLTSVFDGEGTSSTTTAGATASTAGHGDTSTTRPGGSTGTTSGSSTTGATAPGGTTTSVAPLDLGGDRRITLLLIGVDETYWRTEVFADSINVATLNLDTGQVAMFGIPRNMVRIPLGQKTAEALGVATFSGLYHALYGEALKHPEIAPNGNPGAEAIRESAELILGLPIDYYVVVNMLGLVDMVEAFGGVDIKLTSTMHITYHEIIQGEGEQSYVFEAGVNHLNGRQALAFARNRRDSNDYIRMGRQRCVLLGLLYQNSPSGLLLKLPKIAAAIKKNVDTNIPLDALPELIRMRGDIRTDNMIAIGFVPPDYVLYLSEQGYGIPHIALINRTVEAALTDPDRWLRDNPPPDAAASGDCYAIGK
jgi:LCP family protein required for cell wall assembly